MLQHLASSLDSSNENIVDGAFNALSKICEDNVDELCQDGQRSLHSLLPKFVSFLLHPTFGVRKYALNATNQFLFLMPPALAENMEAYMRVRKRGAAFDLLCESGRERGCVFVERERMESSCICRERTESFIL